MWVTESFFHTSSRSGKNKFDRQLPLFLLSSFNFSSYFSVMALNNHKSITNHVLNEEEVSLRSLSSEDISQVVPRGYCCAKSINPADGRGRKLHLLQMLILPFIPILALIVQTSVTLVNIMVLKHDSIEVENQVNNSFKRCNNGNEI